MSGGGERPAIKELGPGFMVAMGFNLVEWSDGRAVIETRLRPEHLNMRGVVHGGVLAALLDTAISWCGLWDPDPARERRCLTLSLTTTFVGQATEGRLRAIGLRRGGGSRIFQATGEVLDEAGTVIALGEGVLRLRSGSEGPSS